MGTVACTSLRSITAISSASMAVAMSRNPCPPRNESQPAAAFFAVLEGGEADKAIDRLEAETAELHTETQTVRATLTRLRTLDGAAETEPDPSMRLN
jgi:hypothetical protein